MSKKFAWVSDVSQGEWLRPMEAEPLGSILSIVPRGFEAYARVFHPVERDRPRDTKSWHGLDATSFFDGVESIAASLETERTSWAMAAASFGTTMHAEAQYARLVQRDDGGTDGAISADGWRYGETVEGCCDAASLAATSAVLARYTTTPDAGIAAIWEGWGGLVSSAGVARLVFESSDGIPAQHSDETDVRATKSSLRQRLAVTVQQRIARARSLIGPVLGIAHDEPKLGSGVLPSKVASGPRFDLHADTGRRYILFEAGASDFADGAWLDRAPWVNENTWPQSPSILWPEDHSWVLATEIDFDSTLVAGSTALIRELVHTSTLEVLPIRTNADLTWDGDGPNRPT